MADDPLTLSEAPAPESSVSGQSVLDALTPAQRETWQKDGALPGETPATGDRDEDDEPATTPATPPTPDAKSGDRPPVPGSNRSKIKALEASNEALQRQLAEIAARVAPPPTFEQPAEPTSKPSRPKFDDFGTYPEYEAALATYEEQLTDWKLAEFVQTQQKQAMEQAARQREMSAQMAYEHRASKWVERRDEYAAAHPEFLAKAGGFLGWATPGTPIGDLVMDSEAGPELALYFGERPDEAARIAALHPVFQVRELGRLEGRLLTSPETARPATAAPAPKHVSTAPAPPVTLGTKPADVADEVESAGARGDFRAYMAAANRRDLARR